MTTYEIRDFENEITSIRKFCASLNQLDTVQKYISDNFKAYSKIKPITELILVQDLLNLYSSIKLKSASFENKSSFSTFLTYYNSIPAHQFSGINLEHFDERVNHEQTENKLVKFTSTDLTRLQLAEMVSNTSPEKNDELVKIYTSIIKRISGFDETKLANLIKDLNISYLNNSINILPDNDSLEIVMKELGGLIGLDAVKQQISSLKNFLEIQEQRKEHKLPETDISLHSVFTGPPGTGKTTVARLLGRIYKHLGYLSKGHLIETDRVGLVAGYVGQTAIKTDEVIKKANGGILFIDEAYSLTPPSDIGTDFGKEAIEILLKRMEDMRSDFVVIVAGYPQEMEVFINQNPGLKSRFNRFINFDHYSADELLRIYKSLALKFDFQLDENAVEKLSDQLYNITKNPPKNFGNARSVRNLFEKTIQNQANRLIEKKEKVRVDYLQITADDIPDFNLNDDKV